MRSLLLFVLGMTLESCGHMDTAYFHTQIGEATQQRVEQRYGMPHRVERRENGETVWIYFERGSATASYGGYSSDKSCRAYLLTFDQHQVLRRWSQEVCDG